MFENPIRRSGVFGPMKQFRAHPLEAMRPITLAALIAIGLPAVFAMDAASTTMSLPENAPRAVLATAARRRTTPRKLRKA
ncbi:hypothetical protein [Corynebacterium sp. NML130628]|uniref:hypothetical protein n=1 Tax=Corynebacterium sp. NML130628 TaxID=1906333 RepID=UPI0008FAFE69|nr:hypothetical protein [Corynebacterium sp. NML130628]OIR42827.1 hypothetical protein BJP07_07960 [Corynebacterium sp. NML130628]